jgi:hypothetical protein
MLTPSVVFAEPGFNTIPDIDVNLYDRVTIVEDPTPGDVWYARAVIKNVRGMYNKVEIDSTSLGAVGIEYKTTQPSQPNDMNSADSACVVTLPDGVAAIPQCVTILEQETETIFLYEYIGG